jgi:hypothetical protein
MARSRNIKPGFFINEDLVELPFATRLLFVGLWTIADREGRLDDRPKKIKMAVFPADEVDIDEGLNQLASRELITRYVVEGERYIQITNFQKHQYPHPNEKESHIPAPEESVISHIPIHLNPSSLNPESLETESREAAAKNGDRPAKKSRPKSPKTDEEFLAELQADYPKLDVAHVNRKMISWCKVNNKQPTRRRLVNWLNREDVPITPAQRNNPGVNGGTPEAKIICKQCLDTGSIDQKPKNAKYEWERESVPCPCRM